MEHLSHLPIGERVARLEQQMEQLNEIRDKLDELLELKHKGLGALQFVGILLGSGVIGVIALVLNVFKPHG